MHLPALLAGVRAPTAPQTALTVVFETGATDGDDSCLRKQQNPFYLLSLPRTLAFRSLLSARLWSIRPTVLHSTG